MRRALIAILAIGCNADDVAIPSPLPLALPGRIVLGHRLSDPHWSTDGKFVAFYARSLHYEDFRPNPMYAVVDAATHVLFEVEHADQLRFAPGRLAIAQKGAFVVYDLATGERVGAPTSISNQMVLAPDGRLAWADGTGAIHLGDITTGTETVFKGMPAPSPAPREAIHLAFSGEHVMAYTANAIRVWRGGPDPIFAVDDTIPRDPILAADGVTYPTGDEDDAQTLHHVALTPVVHEVEFHRDRTCGLAAMQRFSHVLRCDTDRYLVQGPKTFCVWDTARGVVQARFGPLLDEYHCNGEIVWAGNTPPGGPYNFYSVRTGAPTHSRPVPFYEYADGRREEPTPMPREPVASSSESRAILSYADGAMAWQSPAPSEAAGFAFSPDGERLVVVGGDGRVWHVDLATREMTAGKIPDCEPQYNAMAVMPDGRAVVACDRKHEHVVLREGDAAPMLGGEAWPYLGVRASTTTIGWAYGGHAQAWRLPDGQPRWNHAEPGDAMDFTPNGERFVVDVGFPWPKENDHTINLFDASHRRISSIKLDWQVVSLALAPDGKHIAVGRKRDSHVVIFDDTGRIVDDVGAITPVVGWDPSGARFAYLRDTGLAIREGGRDVEVRTPLQPIDSVVHTITWSGSRIALLADQRVTMWDGGQASTFAFTGAGGVEVRADGSAVLLGDVMTARSMIACELGAKRYAIDRCEHKLAMAR
jgi:DNA-binding beta-propeller fold protein YncE